MDRQIIVTGGAGYIGSHTVIELLKEGYEPIIIDDFRNSKPFILDRITEISGETPIHYSVDCTDEEAMMAIFEKHPNLLGIIHFAADKAVGESVTNPLKYYQNNVGSMAVVLKGMAKYNLEHLVFSSSCTVYGEPDQAEVTEDSPVREANSPYGHTKIICEKMIRDVFASGAAIKGTLLRYFNPIGAHPSARLGELPQGIPNNLVPYITQTAKGIREQLTVFGDDYDTPDGTNIRDYIHVVDLARAHVLALNWSLNQSQTFYEAFNLGTGKGSSVLEIINTFEKVNQLKLNYQIGERRAGDVVQIYANGNKAKEVLGWECEYDISAALKHSWEWEKGLE
ncbi:MAG: UDP-glucose 4-epimerase GalE [Flavobacteriales bacterium]|jgi:UDP-glucose 4-epimerase|nr:UDP-glucose 4-epimerase GalE [Flavobacteriales bacterium]